MADSGKDPKKIVEEKGLKQQSDPKELEKIIDKVISDKPDNLIIQDKDKKNVGFLSTKKLSEILKR